MKRKEFLTTCLYGTALAAFVQSCGTEAHVAQKTITGNQISVAKSEFTEIKNGTTSYRKFVIVQTDKFPFPICLFRVADTEYSALLMECTHRGCELKPEGEFLVCPCHGSEFTNKGIVQNPPAAQNLTTFKTSADNDHVYIQL